MRTGREGETMKCENEGGRCVSQVSPA